MINSILFLGKHGFDSKESGILATHGKFPLVYITDRQSTFLFAIFRNCLKKGQVRKSRTKFLERKEIESDNE
jgi:hypothetical protein